MGKKHVSEPINRKFVAYIYCNGFDNIQLGLHVNYRLPNFEVHLPFGFVRVGWVCETLEDRERYFNKYKKGLFGKSIGFKNEKIKETL